MNDRRLGDTGCGHGGAIFAVSNYIDVQDVKDGGGAESVVTHRALEVAALVLSEERWWFGGAQARRVVEIWAARVRVRYQNLMGVCMTAEVGPSDCC